MTVPANKRIVKPLTQAYLREILDYDPETGVFRWKFRKDVPKEWNTRFAGKIAGRVNHSGYRELAINGVLYLEHRLAWLYVHAEFVPEIDHKNLRKSDNSINNLRSVTRIQNNQNVEKRMNNRAGYKGVRRTVRNGKYVYFSARITVNKRVLHLGYFKTAEEAGAAYTTASKKFHGEFGRSD